MPSMKIHIRFLRQWSSRTIWTKSRRSTPMIKGRKMSRVFSACAVPRMLSRLRLTFACNFWDTRVLLTMSFLSAKKKPRMIKSCALSPSSWVSWPRAACAQALWFWSPTWLSQVWVPRTSSTARRKIPTSIGYLTTGMVSAMKFIECPYQALLLTRASVILRVMFIKRGIFYYLLSKLKLMASRMEIFCWTQETTNFPSLSPRLINTAILAISSLMIEQQLSKYSPMLTSLIRMRMSFTALTSTKRPSLLLSTTDLMETMMKLTLMSTILKEIG